MTDLKKTKLIIHYTAVSAKGQAIPGYTELALDEDPTEPTKSSTLDAFTQSCKQSLASQGFIASAVVIGQVIRLWLDVEPPIVTPARITSPIQG